MTNRRIVAALCGAAALASCELVPTPRKFETGGSFVVTPEQPQLLRVRADQLQSLDIWNCGPGAVRWSFADAPDTARAIAAGAGDHTGAEGRMVEVLVDSQAQALVGYRAKGVGAHEAAVAAAPVR